MLGDIFMELANLMYRYINKFINSKELLKELKKIDLNKYLDKEIDDINQLILNVEKINNNIPNEVDAVEKKRISKIEYFLSIIENTIKNDNSEKTKEIIERQYDKLTNDKNTVRDGGELYSTLFNLLTRHPLICEYCKKMSDIELLEFITEYISAPLPPVLNQADFNDLVKVGTENDKRESLWRLAFNYNNKNIDFSLIEDYFIDKKDGYYLIELISAVREDLDVDKIIEKVISTNDKKFIKECASRAQNINLFTKEELEAIKEKYFN